MMLKLIDNVNKALDAEFYYSALTLALTFPDICGKAEYPKENSTKRYKDWYDEKDLSSVEWVFDLSLNLLNELNKRSQSATYNHVR